MPWALQGALHTREAGSYCDHMETRLERVGTELHVSRAWQAGGAAGLDSVSDLTALTVEQER